MLGRFIRRFSSTLRFTRDHEWVKMDSTTNLATFGITDYAQKALGDLVYVELQAKKGVHIKAKGKFNFFISDMIGIVESVKGASDVYAPVDGEVVAINEQVLNKPSLINKHPMGDGWLCQVRVKNVAQVEGLLDETGYQQYCRE